MARARENGPVRPTGWIRVRCPNPECGRGYKVPPEYAGKKARCSECGTLTAIPRVVSTAAAREPAGRRAAPTPAAAAERRTRPARQPEPAAPPVARVREVRVGCIGRGHAGKT